MKIGIVTTYKINQPAGLERSILNILRSILNYDTGNEYIIYTKKSSGIKDDLAKVVSRHFQTIEIGWGKFWKDIGLFFSPQADVYVFNGQTVPLLFSPKNYAVIVYDLAYKYSANNSISQKVKNITTDWLSKLAFKRAKKIIAVSEATKKDLIKFFQVNPDKIGVMYLGLNDLTGVAEKKINNIPEKFFFFPGTLKERKNVLNIIKAYALFDRHYPELNYKLILAGNFNQASDYGRKIAEFLQQANLKNKVIWVGWMDDHGLAYLYKRAGVLVFPSKLEGFGLPVLEAMQLSLPVITSTASSLPEVAGDAAILVDPNDVWAIMNAMYEVISNQELRQELILKGRSQSRIFLWENSAKQFCGIITHSFQ